MGENSLLKNFGTSMLIRGSYDIVMSVMTVIYFLYHLSLLSFIFGYSSTFSEIFNWISKILQIFLVIITGFSFWAYNRLQNKSAIRNNTILVFFILVLVFQVIHALQYIFNDLILELIDLDGIYEYIRASGLIRLINLTLNVLQMILWILIRNSQVISSIKKTAISTNPIKLIIIGFIVGVSHDVMYIFYAFIPYIAQSVQSEFIIAILVGFYESFAIPYYIIGITSSVVLSIGNFISGIRLRQSNFISTVPRIELYKTSIPSAEKKTAQGKFCQICGAFMLIDAHYCPNCGKPSI